MKAYEITFSGRKIGAIGVTVAYRVRRVAENADRAILALYDEFEHVYSARAREVQP